MFGIISRVISSVAAFLFPIFASYKALKASDPTQLIPWLMYWVVIACVIVVENFFGWILNILPLYQEVKAIFLLWLVLPQTQGATHLYLTYIHPYILVHEADIENLISSGHDQLKQTGMIYIRRLWVYLQQVLGIPSQVQARPPTPPHPQGQAPSYVQLLLQRFSLPPMASFDPATNFVSSLFSTFASPANPEIKDMSASNVMTRLQLPNLPPEQKLTYIETQKRKLVEYIKFLDDAAAQQHNEDLTPTSSSRVSQPQLSPPPPPPSDPRRWSLSGVGSTLAQVAEDGFEAVNSDDLPEGSILVTGVKKSDEATRRGWFGSWGGGVGAPQQFPKPQ